jgi:hypothetical protein
MEGAPGPTRLLVADAHKFGPGKIHILDREDRTLCGRSLDSCPGQIRKGHEDDVTCQLCARSWVAAKQRAEWERRQQEREAEWRRQSDERQASRREAFQDGRAGIPTEHRYTRFRSRLEARWAAFFDLIGWRWEYEPFDLDGYIPDFAILGSRPLLIEVKPVLTLAELHRHAPKAERVDRDLLIVGATPELPGSEWSDGRSFAGLMNQWTKGEPEDPRSAWFAEAHWFCCGKTDCRQIGVYHVEGWFIGYPCGHYDGDHYLEPISPTRLERAWAEARNLTQWRSA